MAFCKVSPGHYVPHDINVIVEIPMDADPIKYEVDKVSGAIFVDRVLSTPMRYPCNYGYMPQTLCGDGDPLDVLVVMPLPLIPGTVVPCRPIGLMKMTDENGEDAKIIAVPNAKVFPAYQHIRDIDDVPQDVRGRIQHFFEHYKDLERGKWVRMEGWLHVDATLDEIRRSVRAYADADKH